MRRSRLRTRRSAVGSYRSTSCTMCDTHSHPDFVCNAYWCGAVDSSTCFDTCRAMVRAIHLRMMSPTTMPRMPPSGLRSAVTRPIRSPSRTLRGTCPWLMIVAKLQKISISWSDSTNPRLCSTGMPDGPGVWLEDVLNGHSCRTTQDPTRKASQELVDFSHTPEPHIAFCPHFCPLLLSCTP